MRPIALAIVGLLVALPLCLPAAIPIRGMPEGKPEATIDLATEEGLKLVKGQWRYSDTKIIEVDFRPVPKPAAPLYGELGVLRVYGRYLRTSEAVGNCRAGT